jgi:hypothetical protein
MNTPHRGSLVPFAAVGATVFTAVQYLLFIASGDLANDRLDGDGWFLNNTRNVIVVLTVLVVAAAAVTAARRPAQLVQAAGAFALGAIGAMAAALFLIGPGTIFPIVLIVGAGLVIAAAASGSFAGSTLRSLFGSRG